MTCVTQGSTRSVADCAAPDDGSQQASSNLLQTYAYDYRDRLQGYRAFSNGTKVSWADYLSDPLDRPAQQVDQSGSPNATTTLFSYLGLSNQVSLESEQGQSGPTPLRSYSYDADGNRVSLVDKPGPNETTYMYGYDVQGSVSQLVDRSGQVKAAYGYTPYGSDDSSLTMEGPVKNPYRYTAKRFDTTSRTLDMGARRFGPDIAHFLQQDFYEDALDDVDLSNDPLTQNRYDLAGGNPVSFVELDGHMSSSDPKHSDCPGAIYIQIKNSPQSPCTWGAPPMLSPFVQYTLQPFRGVTIGAKPGGEIVPTPLGPRVVAIPQLGPIHGLLLKKKDDDKKQGGPSTKNGGGSGGGGGSKPKKPKKVHGNSDKSTKTAYLYRLETARGRYLKTGITENPKARYTKAFMRGKRMTILASGPRAQIRALERSIVEIDPGPWNNEPWALDALKA